MSLSSLIVQREIATIRQVEEALARQVLYGGDLTTNLLEVASIEEWRIAVTYADSYSLPAAPPGEIILPSPDLLALMPEEIATKRAMVPLSLLVAPDAKRLVVASSEPLRNEDAEQLFAALGVRIEIRLALDVRVREALSRAYGVPLDRRIERLLKKLAQIAESQPKLPSQSQPPGHAPGARPASVPPFRLSPAYGMAAARSPLAPQNRDETPSQSETAPVEIIAAAPPATPRMRPRHATQLGFPAAPAIANQPEIPASPEPPIVVPAPTTHKTGEYQETKPTFVKATGNAVRPVHRHRGPLTAEVAKEELEEALDREALLDLFFEFARQFFDYAALFIAHGDIAEGRDAFGDGAPRERVVGIGVPLDMPSMLQTAREKKEAVVLHPQSDGIDGVLLSDLRRREGVEAVVIPLLVRDRAVAILYADTTNGIDRHVVDQVSAFAKSVGQGFERLIVRKKLAGFSGGAREGTAGKLDLSALTLPEKKNAASAPLPPSTNTDKRSRAEALGRALFTNDNASPQKPSVTNPETPAARGHIPPVLEVVDDAWDTPNEIADAEPLKPSDPTPIAPAQARRHISERPPPPQSAAVWKNVGPPIPREEDGPPPPEVESAPVPDSISSPKQEREFAEVESETLDDEAAQALLAEIGESPLAADGEEVLVSLPDMVPPVPESSEAVSVGPRLPPMAHMETSLPSIIVDIAGEISALVERVLSGIDDGQSEAELLRQGASAMPAIMARFPGPLQRARGEMQEPLPRATECGPLLRLIARQRKVALPYVLEEAMSPDVSRRFWGTFLLTELPYGEAARVLVPRLYDPDQKVRLVARAAGRAMAAVSHDALLGEIGRVVREPDEARRPSRTARLGLLEALGDMREPKAVSLLIGHLNDDDVEIATVARRSLIAITRQDFGNDTRKWLAWWGQNSSRHRIEWLIDALIDETQGIRRAAGEELKTLTHETFGYYDDLPKRERERAQQRFRDWWASEGKARFVRT